MINNNFNFKNTLPREKTLLGTGNFRFKNDTLTIFRTRKNWYKKRKNIAHDSFYIVFKLLTIQFCQISPHLRLVRVSTWILQNLNIHILTDHFLDNGLVKKMSGKNNFWINTSETINIFKNRLVMLNGRDYFYRETFTLPHFSSHLGIKKVLITTEISLWQLLFTSHFFFFFVIRSSFKVDTYTNYKLWICKLTHMYNILKTRVNEKFYLFFSKLFKFSKKY